jgi:23S rRNA (adenine1618-N6)-methyltransferase
MLQLTKTLLEVDFGLEIELPDDRLCPPVPNRHNYILWLKGLLDTSSYEPPGRKLCGIDVGTGASCIYPLLGTAQRPWHFVATGARPKKLDKHSHADSLQTLIPKVLSMLEGMYV